MELHVVVATARSELDAVEVYYDDSNASARANEMDDQPSVDVDVVSISVPADVEDMDAGDDVDVDLEGGEQITLSEGIVNAARQGMVDED